MSATVQMNIRIGAALKEAGDSALAEIGLTPSQAVRALWEKTARRGKDLHEVANLLRPTAADEPADGANPVEAGWQAMDEALASLGIDPATPLAATDEDLLEELWDERLAQRGLA